MSKADGLVGISTRSATAMPGSISSSLAGPVSTNTHSHPSLMSSSIGLGGSVDLEQLGVLGPPAAGPPAGQAFLRVEIEQRHALALLGRAHGKRAANRRLAGPALGGGQRDDAQSRRLLGSHLVPTPLPGRGDPVEARRAGTNGT